MPRSRICSVLFGAAIGEFPMESISYVQRETEGKKKKALKTGRRTSGGYFYSCACVVCVGFPSRIQFARMTERRDHDMQAEWAKVKQNREWIYQSHLRRSNIHIALAIQSAMGKEFDRTPRNVVGSRNGSLI